MQDIIRMAVKRYKVETDTNYKTIANELNITKNSFYNWLKGYYDLSDEKVHLLQMLLNNRTEEE